MFGEIFRFELRYQLRQPIFWIGCAVFFLLTFLATTTDAVVIGGSSGQVHRNAAWVVMQIHLMMSMLGMFFVAAMVASSVVRDAQHHTEEIFFTLPIRKLDYLLGRFAGAVVAAILTGVPVSLGIALGSLMPWLEPERLGPFAPAVYAFSLLALYAPNVILVSCVLFAIATPSRSLILTYGGVVGIMVAYGVAGALAADVSNARAATLLDPLGHRRVRDRDPILDRSRPERRAAVPRRALPRQPRALARASRSALLAFTCWRFSFTISRPQRAGAIVAARRASRLGRARRSSLRSPRRVAACGAARRSRARRPLRQLAPADAHGDHAGACAAWRSRSSSRSAIMNVIGNSEAIDVLFGTPVYPVTHLMVSILEGSSLFLLAIVVFYAGEIVFRERTLDAADVTDAMPVPDWVQWASKLAGVRLDRGLDAHGLDPGRHRRPDLARLPPLRARALPARHAAGGGRRCSSSPPCSRSSSRSRPTTGTSASC